MNQTLRAMKKKYYIPALLFLFVIASFACKESPTENEDIDGPIVFGTWQVVAENKANWIGDQNKAKSFKADSTRPDTIIVYQPENYYMDILDLGNNALFELSFNDSTITGGRSVNTKLTKVEVLNNNNNLTPQGGGYGAGDFGIFIRMDLSYNCNNQLTDDRVIQISTYTKADSSVFAVYRIESTGLSETLNTVVCN